ncbi:Hypothetical predicted protein [Olea europaea subsp. europaea]|uniref:Uncharacterized protein n=1 Tax=Olea europaea subsp. europaea TaxID=158383 RepID=A0A8S0PLT8_OLEEU|nr:Hypothetical predicted protein [Olea europaea subsp. europaea]
MSSLINHRPGGEIGSKPSNPPKLAQAKTKTVRNPGNPTINRKTGQNTQEPGQTRQQEENQTKEQQQPTEQGELDSNKQGSRTKTKQTGKNQQQEQNPEQ